MAIYNITLKDQDATPDGVKAEKEKITKAGGKILDELKLIKGFIVEFPDDQVSVLSDDPNLDVEADSEVRIQPEAKK